MRVDALFISAALAIYQKSALLLGGEGWTGGWSAAKTALLSGVEGRGVADQTLTSRRFRPFLRGGTPLSLAHFGPSCG